MSTLDRLTLRMKWLRVPAIWKLITSASFKLATGKASLKRLNEELLALDQSQESTVTPQRIMKLLTSMKKMSSINAEDDTRDIQLLGLIYDGQRQTIMGKHFALENSLAAGVTPLIIDMQK